MAAVQEKTFRIDVTQRRSVVDAGRNYTRFSSGDVLFAKITPCMENGKVAVVPDTPERILAGSTEFHVVRSSALIPHYLAFWLNQDRFRDEAARHMTGTAGQMRVPADYLRLSRLPVPPLDEQQNVVDRTNELLLDVDDGEAALARARADLQVYRRALLKAAVTGELTADWRAANPARETGAELLARILADRRARWHLEPWNAGKKYQEPGHNTSVELPALPVGWTWATLAQCCSRITDGTHQPPTFVPSGVPFVTISSLRDEVIKWDTVSRFVTHETYRRETARLKPSVGDILYTAVGASFGRAFHVRENRDFMFQRHIAHLRPCISASYLTSALNSPIVFHQAQRLAKGVAQPTVTLGDLASFAIPVPPALEQKELESRLHREAFEQKTMCETFEQQIDNSSVLRQSILAAAFRGDLT